MLVYSFFRSRACGFPRMYSDRRASAKPAAAATLRQIAGDIVANTHAAVEGSSLFARCILAYLPIAVKKPLPVYP